MSTAITAERPTALGLPPIFKSRSKQQSPTKEGLPSQNLAGKAALVIDAESRIISCSPAIAELMGRTAEALTSHPIKEVFPSLPMSTDTPGYNVAYASMYGAHGAWSQQVGQSTNKGAIPLEVSLTCIKVDKRHQIAINIRCA